MQAMQQCASWRTSEPDSRLVPVLDNAQRPIAAGMPRAGERHDLYVDVRQRGSGLDPRELVAHDLPAAVHAVQYRLVQDEPPVEEAAQDLLPAKPDRHLTV